MRDIEQRPGGVTGIFADIKERAGKDGILIGSFDIDGMNMFPDEKERDAVQREDTEGVPRGTYGGMSLATGTPVDRFGPHQKDVLSATGDFANDPRVVASEISEFNPGEEAAKDDPHLRTADIVYSMVEAIFPDRQRSVDDDVPKARL
jgi:arginase family enzyme